MQWQKLVLIIWKFIKEHISSNQVNPPESLNHSDFLIPTKTMNERPDIFSQGNTNYDAIKVQTGM